METYVVLMKLTNQGIKDIKNAPERIAANAKAMEAVGGKMTASRLVQISIAEISAIAGHQGLSQSEE
jgi:uncharacterized protein with GYD domain